MPHLIFVDTVNREHLLPFTATRPIADIRVGIFTLREKWQKFFKVEGSSTHTVPYLSIKFPLVTNSDNILIYDGLIPTQELVNAILNLPINTNLIATDGVLIASRADETNITGAFETSNSFANQVYTGNSQILSRNWHIFMWNEAQIAADFELLTAGRQSQIISSTNSITAPENIFLEAGAVVEHAIINAKNAKVYIAKDAEVMEGCLIRGSFALGEHSQLKMGAKVYGATTIGPHSKVGGEINNSVIFGFSNKAHDGFMGNSVIGEWCNWGADSNNSNLKNNYEEVKLWSYVKESFEKSGSQFCGLMMGDHSKCGINTMFNTGTVVGVSANIFGAGFPRNFIADFSWGGAGGTMTYQLNKAVQTASLVYARRGMEFNEMEQAIFESIFTQTEKWRAS
jgi:UDP-N-acetylglucosamine diphosphorylase/glucosamine-1-phosphate N-acetyltransferase